MVLATKVRARKGQLLVALPATIARHLVVATGALVYWGMPRTHQAVLSVKPTPARGTERPNAACSSCAAYRKEIEQLRARLHQQPAKLVASALTQVRLQWLAQMDLGPGWASRIEAQLAKLDQRIGELPGARGRRARPSRPQGTALDVAFSLPD